MKKRIIVRHRHSEYSPKEHSHDKDFYVLTGVIIFAFIFFGGCIIYHDYRLDNLESQIMPNEVCWEDEVIEEVEDCKWLECSCRQILRLPNHTHSDEFCSDYCMICEVRNETVTKQPCKEDVGR